MRWPTISPRERGTSRTGSQDDFVQRWTELLEWTREEFSER